MSWQFDNNRPIYSQLLEKFQMMIISGQYAPGSRLPSVRDLASEASVNPNTMQRALSELETSGLLFSQRTSGRYVTEDINLISSMKESVAKGKLQELFSTLYALGFETTEAKDFIEKNIKELHL